MSELRLVWPWQPPRPDSQSQSPSGITLKLTVNARLDPILTTLPLADLLRPPLGTQQIFPQIGFGLGFDTEKKDWVLDEVLVQSTHNSVVVLFPVQKAKTA